MIVRVTRFGKKITRKDFDLNCQTNEFKAYMKKQKKYVKTITVSRKKSLIVIHADLQTKDEIIIARVLRGKSYPFENLFKSSINAEILLGY